MGDGIKNVEVYVHGRPQTFSQGRANFSGGLGQTFPKKCLKTYYFLSKKVKKRFILAGQGGGGKCPPLPSPADAHVYV